MDANTLARENDVIIYTVVPHTTHEMQPLGTAVFGSFKKNLNEECHKFVYPQKVITEYQFSEIFSEAWLKSMVPDRIISGFKVCGIYPFNPKAVLDHDPCTPPKEKSKHNSSKPNKKDDTSGEVEFSWEKGDQPQHQGSVNNDDVAELFTPEEETLFARRYEEGYNLYDARYASWIRATHLDDSSEELLSFFQT